MDLYNKQKAAEAKLYENEKAAEAQRTAADAQLYAAQQAADGELYAKRKEAEGLVALAQAEGVYLSTLSKAQGGDYNKLRDYMTIDGGMFKDIAKLNAEAIGGCSPRSACGPTVLVESWQQLEEEVVVLRQ